VCGVAGGFWGHYVSGPISQPPKRLEIQSPKKDRLNNSPHSTEKLTIKTALFSSEISKYQSLDSVISSKRIELIVPKTQNVCKIDP
jgi:hypothetical protein